MRLVITRHGETEENKKRIVQGHLHGKLSKLGKAQAKKLAHRLKKEKFDYIFSSDLARALSTAKEVHRFHKKTPLKLDKMLRERHMGHMQGGRAFSDWGKKKWEIKTIKKLKLETPKQLLTRAQTLLKKLLKQHRGKNVLLVSHGAITQALITALTGKHWKDIRKIDWIGNTSITIFEFNDKKIPKLKLFNDMKHLGKRKKKK